MRHKLFSLFFVIAAIVFLGGIPSIAGEAAKTMTTGAGTKTNGWIIAQGWRGYDGPNQLSKWISRYGYCTPQAWRYDGDSGFMYLAKAPDWKMYCYSSSAKAYTCMGTPWKSVGGDESSQKGRQDGEATSYARVRVNGVNPPIAGLKVSQYQMISKSEQQVSMEWFTADPQSIPPELKDFAKFLIAAGSGEHELLLRRCSVATCPESTKNRIRKMESEVNDTSRSEKARDRSRRELELERKISQNPDKVGERTTIMDTSWCKRFAVPAATFAAPQGYRELPEREFFLMHAPGWIQELDRNTPH